MSRLLIVVMLAACGGSSAAPPAQPKPTPAPAPVPVARPSVDECKVLFEHLIEVALVEFEEDEAFRDEIMAGVRVQAAGPREARCRDEATPEQVACLQATRDVEAVRGCAEPIYQCTQSDPRDEPACATMEREWSWAADVIAGMFDMTG